MFLVITTRDFFGMLDTYGDYDDTFLVVALFGY